MQPSVVAGVCVVAVATVAGTWLARRGPGRQDVWFGAAAGALLVIAGLHLLPDAWRAARTEHLWPWAVPAAALASYWSAWLVARFGCACEDDVEHASGMGTAAALAAHRFLEGSALALSGSVTVAAALAAHALGEGLAVGALLGEAGRRHVVTWLTAMCVGPAVGAAVAGAYLEAAGPVLIAAAAGVLVQAARISLRAAFRRIRPRVLLLSPPAAAVAVAAALTAFAVHTAG